MKRFNQVTIHQVLNYYQLTMLRELRKQNYNEFILDENFWQQIVIDDKHNDQSLSWTKEQVEYIQKNGWEKWWISEGPFGPFGPDESINNKQ
jgi:hypothetical protein